MLKKCSDQHTYAEKAEREKPLLWMANRAGEKPNLFPVISEIHVQAGDFAKTLDVYLQTMELARQEGRTTELGLCCRKMAFLYYHIGDYQRALHYIHESLELHSESGGRRSTAPDLYLLGNIYIALDRGDDALPVVQQALEMVVQSGDNSSLSDVYICLGRIYSRHPGTLAALQWYRRALALSHEAENHRPRAYCLYCIGEFLVQKKRYSSAVHFLEEARSSTNSTTSDQRIEYVICDRLSMLYELQGNIAEALHYKKLYNAFKEEVHGYEQQRAISDVQIRHAVGKVEQQREKYCLIAESLETEIRYREQILGIAGSSIREKNALMRRVHGYLRELLDKRGNKTQPLRRLLCEMRQHMNRQQDKVQFEQLFEEVHSDYMYRLSQQFPLISPTEIKICALIKTNLSTKEIASLLSLSRHTIATHRYSIRKKLGISPDVGLVTWLSSL